MSSLIHLDILVVLFLVALCLHIPDRRSQTLDLQAI